MMGFLFGAIQDRDVIFYIRDKEPIKLGDACCLYKRFRLLSNQGDHQHPSARLTVSEEYDKAISEAKIKQNSNVDRRPSSYAVRSFMDQTNRSLD